MTFNEKENKKMTAVKVTKNFQVAELEDGTTRVVSSDKQQMARWYALDYLLDKPQITSTGNYTAIMSPAFRFSPSCRKLNK